MSVQPLTESPDISISSELEGYDLTELKLTSMMILLLGNYLSSTASSNTSTSYPLRVKRECGIKTSFFDPV